MSPFSSNFSASHTGAPFTPIFVSFRHGRNWSEKLSFALWAYHTSFRTSTVATLFSLVYDMEVILPVEIKVGSLRIVLEH